MKTALFFICVFLHVKAFGQQNDALHVKGPRMVFDFTTLTDSIRWVNTDSTLFYMDTIYYFPFSNQGDQPLLVGFARGSEPGFNCKYPQQPVPPGQHDSLGFCFPEMYVPADYPYKNINYSNKMYRVNSNDTISQVLWVKRVLTTKK